MRTCDTMTSIDGITLDTPSFALTVSDALTPEMAIERIAWIVGLSAEFQNMRFICVRDDAMDAGMLASTAVLAAGTGLGLIVQSDMPENLVATVSALEGRRPLLITPDTTSPELIVFAGEADIPIAVSHPDTDSLLALCSMAEASGCGDIVLDPCTVSMKQCLESTVRIGRLASEDPRADRPLMVRAWSGEYALSVASVSVLRGGSLAVLDDLDRDACDILDKTVSSFGKNATL